MTTLKELMSLGMLNQCAWESTKQSRWKETTQRYLADMLARNLELQQEVLTGTYRVKPTVDFTLNERGHIRKIEAPVVRDRIVQKTLMKNLLVPLLRPYLIYDNYASLTDRGTSFARKRFETMLRRYTHKYGTDGYVLFFDVRKYFENIDHEVLKQMIAPRLEGEPQEVVELVYYMIDTSSKTDKGLNLGSECPQIFAVYYLNPLDQFIKVVKGIKYYGRYMDDGFIIARTKGELVKLLSELRAVMTSLRLEFNEKKTHIVKIRHVFVWLQIKYNIKPSGRILKRMSHGKIVRERRRLKAFKRLYDAGKKTEQEIWNCYQSWRGTVAKDHNACRNTLRRMDKLYCSLFPSHHEERKVGRREQTIQAFREAETRDLHQYMFNN